MRCPALALALLAFGCSDNPEVEDTGGTSGVSGSSSGEGEIGEESSGAEESSTGEVGAWDGEVIAIRGAEPEPGRGCGEACGTSACLGGFGDDPTIRRECNQVAVTCECGDEPEVSGLPATHGVSECFFDPNAAHGGELEPLPYTSCDDFCASNGLGACAWTHWISGLGDGPSETPCFDWWVDGGRRQFGEDMTIRSPFDDGEGRVRFVCEL